jgi:hypothetical protein
MSASSARNRLGRALSCAVVLITAGAASANELSLECQGQNVFTVVDNGLGDEDPAPDVVRRTFLCTHPDGRWQAEGVLTGLYEPGVSATTILSDFYVEKLTPAEVLGNTINWEHRFPEYTTALAEVSAMIDGQFDNTGGLHFIGGIILSYSAVAANIEQSYPILVSNFGPIDGFGPVPFADADGPIDVVSPNRHLGGMGFYLDTVGDRIDMQTSAVIHSQIPEPATATLLVMATMVSLTHRSGLRVFPKARYLAGRR